MIIRHLLRPTQKPKNARTLCTKPNFQKSIQVAVLGANSRVGSHTSFLLKQNPFISALHLQGCHPLKDIGKDLGVFDTKCRVVTYCGTEDSIASAIKSADVVLILPAETPKEDLPIGERVMQEGKRLYKIAVQCTQFAPRAVLVVCVPPVSITTPLVSEVFKKTNFYHPGRIFGSAALAQTKANSIFARYQDMDPQNCYVPLLGGPDIDLAVPLFSKAKPIEILGKLGQRKVTARFRGVKEDEFPKNLGNPNIVEDCALAESYALNVLVSNIALGICGDQKALANVFMRSNAVNACRYLVSTVRFSRGGVVHNFGVPTISKLELELLERAALEIQEREKMAQDYLEYIEGKSHDKKKPAFIEKEEKEQDMMKEKIIR